MNEYRQIPGWPKYIIGKDGTVAVASTGEVLKQWKGTVCLSVNRYRRSRCKVCALIKKAWPIEEKLRYEAPLIEQLNNDGEVFREYVEFPDYLVSNQERVFSMKTLKFVGQKGSSKNAYVEFSVAGEQYARCVHIMRDITFTPNIPSNDGEVWKPLKESPFYFVSNYGRIWGLKHRCFIKPHPNERGYMRWDSPFGVIRVHRLVAEYFVPGKDLFRTSVNHINEDKSDNRAINLEWCTPEENTEAYMKNHGYWYHGMY